MPAGSSLPAHLILTQVVRNGLRNFVTKHAQQKSFTGLSFVSCCAEHSAKSNPSVPEHRQAPTPELIEHGRPNINMRQLHHKWHTCTSAAGHIA